MVREFGFVLELLGAFVALASRSPYAVDVHEALSDGIEDRLGMVADVELWMLETWFLTVFSGIARERVICSLPPASGVGISKSRSESGALSPLSLVQQISGRLQAPFVILDRRPRLSAFFSRQEAYAMDANVQ